MLPMLQNAARCAMPAGAKQLCACAAKENNGLRQPLQRYHACLGRHCLRTNNFRRIQSL